MPNARSFFRVRFVWLLRATALRRWCHAIFLAALASSFSSARGDDKPQERTNAATAVCTWHTVSSGFSPPSSCRTATGTGSSPTTGSSGVSIPVAPALVLIQADLALLVLEATFHTPPREGHQEQNLRPGPRGALLTKNFSSPGSVRCGPPAGERLARQAVLPFDRQHHVACIPRPSAPSHRP